MATTPLNEADRASYITMFKNAYRRYLGRDASDAELAGYLDSKEHAEAALNAIPNSPEYRALKDSHPDWFDTSGALKTGYTNAGAGGGGTGGTGGGGGGNNYGTRANLDRGYLEQQIREAFAAKGVQDPSQSDIDYWIQKATTPDTYSDGKMRVGWNGYLRQRLISGSSSADPGLAGDEGVIANPSQWGLHGGGSETFDLNSPLMQRYSTPPPDIPNWAAFQAPTWQEAMNDPGYQFALKTGQEALIGNRSAQGLLGSSGTLKNMAQFNQQAAANQYNNVYNRKLQEYNTNYATQAVNPYTARYQQWGDLYNQYRQWQSDAWGRARDYAGA